MTAPINALLVCALQRSMREVTSEELLDMAMGLAESAGWTPADLAGLTRKAVAKRLQSLASSGQAQQVGQSLDTRSRRLTPSWAPTIGYDPDAEVPDAPAGRDAVRDDALDDMTPNQLRAVIDVGDDICGAVGRFFRDMEDVRDRARRKLAAVGLEPGK